MCPRNPSLMTLQEDDSKTWLFFPRGQVLGLASLLPHFSWFSLSQQCPSSFLGWVVFSYWRVGTSEAQLPPSLWDCCTDSKPCPPDPPFCAACTGVWGVQGCGRLVSVRNTTHSPRCIYSGAWTQWTYRWSAKICTQHGFASRLCADKLSDLRQVWYPFSTSIS